MNDFREAIKSSLDYGYHGANSLGWGEVSSYVHRYISNKRVLCLGRPEKFPLYGYGYTNNLFSAKDDDPLGFIEANHIDYVVGFRPFLRYGANGETWDYLTAPTKALRERHPERFQVIYAVDGAEVMKVLQ